MSANETLAERNPLCLKSSCRRRKHTTSADAPTAEPTQQNARRSENNGFVQSRKLATVVAIYCLRADLHGLRSVSWIRLQKLMQRLGLRDGGLPGRNEQINLAAFDRE